MNKNLTRALYALPVLALLGYGAYVYFPAWFDGGGGGSTGRVTKNCQGSIDARYCDPSGSKCDVRVEISDCAAGPKLVPETLYVCKPNTKITWTLYPSGLATDAKFAGNGIDFKGNPEFFHPPGHPAGTNTTFDWTDKRSKRDSDPPEPYKYDVHILKKDASDCYHKDPQVVNE